jgi:hypothetical protein
MTVDTGQAGLEATALRHLTLRLVTEYADRYPAEYVEQAVTKAHQSFAYARVRNYAPVLTERAAREILGTATLRRAGRSGPSRVGTHACA